MKPLLSKDLVVDTKSGRVRGEYVGGISAFKGIPYAAPPFGPRHLRPPQPVEPWEGVRDALEFGPKSPQSDYPPQVSMLLPEFNHPGEDCLTLNIWTPDVELAGLPVMVWIPGGMYEYHGTSASPWYDGTGFACDGIVCVTINYRVGAEGFLYLGPGTANRGLLDQIAALEWVRDNIRSFGGDPQNVTIFGESAGALSIGTLLAMPRAEGLFRRAILQSGSAQHTLPVEIAERITERFAAALGVEPEFDTMAALPPERLVRDQGQIRADLAAVPDPSVWGAEVVLTNLPWQPVVEVETLPALPLERVARGASKGVDLMVGTNLDENRLFLVPGGIID
ncbi:MAG: carboxylesterase family protein, partial [Fimbriimonadaceae bacterium]|nr:carboxylesterase family protein [Fimbriimonadaceae bacterium]